MFNSDRKTLYIQYVNKRIIKVSELVFFTAYVIYLISNMLGTTMLRVYVNDKIPTIINLLTFLLIIFKIIVFDNYSLKKLNIIILIGISVFFSYLSSGYSNLIFLGLFIIGAKDVSFDRIIKIYLIIGITITIMAFIAVYLGLIEHIIYYRNGQPRYSFGSIYCTDFAARIFYLIISFFYLSNKKISIKSALSFFLIGCFTYYFCGARLDSICIFFTSCATLYVIYRRKKNINISFVIKKVLIYSVPLSCIMTIIVTVKYNAYSGIMIFLDKMLSGRLNIGKQGIDQYGFSLFGQNIFMKGNGGTNEAITDYFFIDSSYIFIGLRYGILLLIILCILYFISTRNSINNGDIILPICVLLIAINSIVAHHFTEIAYNPFLLVFFASIKSSKKNTCIDIIRNGNKNMKLNYSM